jgi:hypothetical protein
MHPATLNQFKTFIFEKKLHPVIFIASETWKSERSYTPFSPRLGFLREFDPLRWYQKTRLPFSVYKRGRAVTIKSARYAVL